MWIVKRCDCEEEEVEKSLDVAQQERKNTSKAKPRSLGGREIYLIWAGGGEGVHQRMEGKNATLHTHTG